MLFNVNNQIRNKKIIVLGGAGFIGSHLCDALLKEEAEKVIVVDNLFLGKKKNLEDSFEKYPGKIIFKKIDATSYEDLKKIIEEYRPEIMFNLATKALLHSFDSPIDAYKVNADIALNACNLLREKYFDKLIHLSSSEVFGTARDIPMTEAHPLYPETTYAAGKASADLLVHAYVQMFQINALVLRPFNNYGPRQNWGRLAAIIPVTIKRILEGKKPLIQGTGNQTRDYIFVHDTVRIIIDFAKSSKWDGFDYNIGSGKETSVIEIVKNICNFMDYKGDIDFQEKRCADVGRHIAGTKKTSDFLGSLDLISIEEGIKKTVDWYLKNKEFVNDTDM